MAVGDGGNDLAMLAGVTAAGGLGVAMANAVPPVRPHMECAEAQCRRHAEGTWHMRMSWAGWLDFSEKTQQSFAL